LPIYRIYLLEAGGHVTRPALEVECADDAAARQAAQACGHNETVEVWEGRRMVFQILPGET
jgi:hypothetical protein